MALDPIEAESAQNNLIHLQAAFRPLRADVPMFNPKNPLHLRAWEAVWDFANKPHAETLPGELRHSMDARNREFRHSLEQSVQTAIDLLDLIDGDPDSELDGDEADCSFSEDCFVDHGYVDGQAGCPISDPGGCEHDGREHVDCY